MLIVVFISPQDMFLDNTERSLQILYESGSQLKNLQTILIFLVDVAITNKLEPSTVSAACLC